MSLGSKGSMDAIVLAGEESAVDPGEETPLAPAQEKSEDGGDTDKENDDEEDDDEDEELSWWYGGIAKGFFGTLFSWTMPEPVMLMRWFRPHFRPIIPARVLYLLDRAIGFHTLASPSLQFSLRRVLSNRRRSKNCRAIL